LGAIGRLTPAVEILYRRDAIAYNYKLVQDIVLSKLSARETDVVFVVFDE